MQEDIDCNKKGLFGMMRNRRRDKERTMYLTDDNIFLITEGEEIKETWRKYFDELLNVNNKAKTVTIQAEEKRKIDDGPDLTWRDIEFAWKFIKNGKSTGMDEISGEMVKMSGNVGKQWLYRLFHKIWEEKTIPSEWKEGVIIPRNANIIEA